MSKTPVPADRSVGASNAPPPYGVRGDGPDGSGRATTPAPAARLAAGWEILLLGVFLTALVAASVYGLIAMWPAVEAATSRQPHPATVHVFGARWQPTHEVALLLLVVSASALGGALHATISFTDYVGNGRLMTSWIWWYVLRVLLGTALAVLFYFALRGGLFSANTPTNVINPFGIGALAGLVGLFHKQAADKLREMFDTMFRTAPGRGDDQRADSIENPAPVMGGVEPSSMPVDASDLELTVHGEGFVRESVVRVSRSANQHGPLLARSSHVSSPTRLHVSLDPRDVTEAGTVYLTVLNPPPGGGVSKPAEVEIEDTASRRRRTQDGRRPRR